MKKLIFISSIVLIILIAFSGCSGVKTYGKDDTNIVVSSGQEFIIKLAENPTTGYKWNYIISDENIITLVKDDYSPDDKTGLLVGSGGSRILTFKGLAKGKVEISLVYEPTYKKNASQNKLIYHIEVK